MECKDPNAAASAVDAPTKIKSVLYTDVTGVVVRHLGVYEGRDGGEVPSWGWSGLDLHSMGLEMSF